MRTLLQILLFLNIVGKLCAFSLENFTEALLREGRRLEEFSGEESKKILNAYLTHSLISNLYSPELSQKINTILLENIESNIIDLVNLDKKIEDTVKDYFKFTSLLLTPYVNNMSNAIAKRSSENILAQIKSLSSLIEVGYGMKSSLADGITFDEQNHCAPSFVDSYKPIFHILYQAALQKYEKANDASVNRKSLINALQTSISFGNYSINYRDQIEKSSTNFLQLDRLLRSFQAKEFYKTDHSEVSYAKPLEIFPQFPDISLSNIIEEISDTKTRNNSVNEVIKRFAANSSFENNLKIIGLLLGDKFIDLVKVTVPRSESKKLLKLEGGESQFVWTMIFKLFSDNYKSLKSKNKQILNELHARLSIGILLFQQRNEKHYAELLFNLVKRHHNFIIPVSWHGNDPHSLAISIENNQNNNVDIVIMNTGEGIQYHPAGKQRWSSVLRYSKVFKNEIPDLFWHAIYSFSSSNPFGPNENASNFYTTLMSMLPYSKIVNETPREIGGQLSGTCSIKSFLNVLKMNLDYEEYSELTVRMRVQAFTEYVPLITKNLKNRKVFSLMISLGTYLLRKLEKLEKKCAASSLLENNNSLQHLAKSSDYWLKEFYSKIIESLNIIKLELSKMSNVIELSQYVANDFGQAINKLLQKNTRTLKGNEGIIFTMYDQDARLEPFSNLLKFIENVSVDSDQKFGLLIHFLKDGFKINFSQLSKYKASSEFESTSRIVFLLLSSELKSNPIAFHIARGYYILMLHFFKVINDDMKIVTFNLIPLEKYKFSGSSFFQMTFLMSEYLRDLRGVFNPSAEYSTNTDNQGLEYILQVMAAMRDMQGRSDNMERRIIEPKKVVVDGNDVDIPLKLYFDSFVWTDESKNSIKFPPECFKAIASVGFMIMSELTFFLENESFSPKIFVSAHKSYYPSIGNRSKVYLKTFWDSKTKPLEYQLDFSGTINTKHRRSLSLFEKYSASELATTISISQQSVHLSEIYFQTFFVWIKNRPEIWLINSDKFSDNFLLEYLVRGDLAKEMSKSKNLGSLLTEVFKSHAKYLSLMFQNSYKIEFLLGFRNLLVFMCLLLRENNEMGTILRPMIEMYSKVHAKNFYSEKKIFAPETFKLFILDTSGDPAAVLSDEVLAYFFYAHRDLQNVNSVRNRHNSHLFSVFSAEVKILYALWGRHIQKLLVQDKSMIFHSIASHKCNLSADSKWIGAYPVFVSGICVVNFSLGTVIVSRQSTNPISMSAIQSCREFIEFTNNNAKEFNLNSSDTIDLNSNGDFLLFELTENSQVIMRQIIGDHVYNYVSPRQFKELGIGTAAIHVELSPHLYSIWANDIEIRVYDKKIENVSGKKVISEHIFFKFMNGGDFFIREDAQNKLRKTLYRFGNVATALSDVFRPDCVLPLSSSGSSVALIFNHSYKGLSPIIDENYKKNCYIVDLRYMEISNSIKGLEEHNILMSSSKNIALIPVTPPQFHLANFHMIKFETTKSANTTNMKPSTIKEYFLSDIVSFTSLTESIEIQEFQLSINGISGIEKHELYYEIVTQSRMDSLICAYQYLASNDYDRAMLQLQSIPRFQPLNQREYQILAWIFYIPKYAFINSPLSMIVRTQAVEIARSFDLRKASFFKEKESTSLNFADMTSVNTFLLDSSVWPAFWFYEEMEKYIANSLRSMHRYLRALPSSYHNLVPEKYMYENFYDSKIIDIYKNNFQQEDLYNLSNEIFKHSKLKYLSHTVYCWDSPDYTKIGNVTKDQVLCILSILIFRHESLDILSYSSDKFKLASAYTDSRIDLITKNLIYFALKMLSDEDIRTKIRSWVVDLEKENYSDIFVKIKNHNLQQYSGFHFQAPSRRLEKHSHRVFEFISLIPEETIWNKQWNTIEREILEELNIQDLNVLIQNATALLQTSGESGSCGHTNWQEFEKCVQDVTPGISAQSTENFRKLIHDFISSGKCDIFKNSLITSRINNIITKQNEILLTYQNKKISHSKFMKIQFPHGEYLIKYYTRLIVGATHSNFENVRRDFPELDDEGIAILHSNLTRIFVLLNIEKRLKRVYSILTKENLCEEDFSKLSEDLIDHPDDLFMRPELLMFEYHANFRLRNSHIDDLFFLTGVPLRGDHLKKNRPSSKVKILQRAMAGGKSAVLGPLASWYLSIKNIETHQNYLPFVILPPSLLGTAGSDLISRSLKRLGQSGHLFKFERSDSFIQNANEILSLFENAKVNQEYIVTTPMDILSLINTFFDLAKSNSPISKQFQKILNFLKDEAIGIFDEIDTTFNPFTELIFPIGNAIKLKDGFVQFVIDMFYLCLTNQKIISIVDLTDPTVKIDFSKYTEFTEMVFNDPSMKAYKAFYRTKVDESSSKINAESDLSLLITRFIDKILFSALQREHLVEYGLVTNLQDERLYAVPFVAAKTASTQAQFSDPLVALAKTMLSYCRSEIREPFKASIYEKLSRILVDEVKAEQVILEETKHWKNLKSNINDVVNCPNSAYDFINDGALKFSLCLNELKKERPLFYVKLFLAGIQEIVVPQIQIYSEQVASSSQDFLFLFHSMVGYTGTLYNSSIFNSLDIVEIKSDSSIEAAFVADMYRKNTQVLVVQPKDGKRVTLYDVASAAKTKNLRSVVMIPEFTHINALIDLGALTKNIAEEDLLNSIVEGRNQKISTILYYQPECSDLLCRKINLGVLSQESKALKSTDLIDVETNTQPNERFTIYDQFHTTGTDIAQDPNAIAWLTVGIKSKLRDLLQALIRMRQYSKNQNVLLVIDSNVASQMRKVLKLSDPNIELTVKDIVQYTYIYQSQIIQSELQTSFLQKISSIVRFGIINSDSETNVFDNPFYIYRQYDYVKPEDYKSFESKLDCFLTKLPSRMKSTYNDILLNQSKNTFVATADPISETDQTSIEVARVASSESTKLSQKTAIEASREVANSLISLRLSHLFNDERLNDFDISKDRFCPLRLKLVDQILNSGPQVNSGYTNIPNFSERNSPEGVQQENLSITTEYSNSCSTIETLKYFWIYIYNAGPSETKIQILGMDLYEANHLIPFIRNREEISIEKIAVSDLTSGNFDYPEFSSWFKSKREKIILSINSMKESSIVVAMTGEIIYAPENFTHMNLFYLNKAQVESTFLHRWDVYEIMVKSLFSIFIEQKSMFVFASPRNQHLLSKFRPHNIEERLKVLYKELRHSDLICNEFSHLNRIMKELGFLKKSTESSSALSLAISTEFNDYEKK